MKQNRRIIAAASLSLVMAGCAVAPDRELVATSPENSIVADDGVVAPLESPLNEYLALVLGFGHTPSEVEQIDRNRAMREQEVIAECMHEQGFEYIPFIQPTPQIDLTYPDDPDWVAQYGYGIFTVEQSESTSQQVEFQFQSEFHDEGQYHWGALDAADPNVAILQALNESERNAWGAAFWGWRLGWHGVDEDGNQYTQVTNERVGCRNISWEIANDETPFSIFRTAEFEPLFNAWAEMTFSTWSEVIDADQDWANCMADNGFPNLQQQQDAVQSLFSYFNANQARDENNELTDEFLSDIRTLEIRTASADLRCRIAVDYAAQRDAHRIEVETQFLADHRPALEALRDAAEQRGVTWLDN